MAQITLTQDEKIILNYIQEGHDIMSELFDLTGWNGERINACIERMDENRYIERASLHGAGFWSFSMTAMGQDALPPLEGQAAELAKIGLCPRDLEVLQICKNAGKARATEIIANTKADTHTQVNYAGSVVKLIRRGYLKESGFLKRIIEINSSGEQMLEKGVEFSKEPALQEQAE